MQGFPTAVSASVVACTKGVKRAHLVHAAIDGGMLLELYSRDGIGTMISTDFYEGIRRARSSDQDAIQVGHHGCMVVCLCMASTVWIDGMYRCGWWVGRWMDGAARK